MRAVVTAAVLATLALAGCGGDAGAVEEPASNATEGRLCPSYGEKVDENALAERAELDLVGLRFDAAEARAEAAGCSLAAARIDGESQPLTREYDPTRIQVDVEDGEIARVQGFG